MAAPATAAVDVDAGAAFVGVDDGLGTGVLFAVAVDAGFAAAAAVVGSVFATDAPCSALLLIVAVGWAVG